jgi:hypothetical protein
MQSYRPAKCPQHFNATTPSNIAPQHYFGSPHLVYNSRDLARALLPECHALVVGLLVEPVSTPPLHRSLPLVGREGGSPGWGLQPAQKVWIARINRAMTGSVVGASDLPRVTSKTVIARFIRAIQLPSYCWIGSPAPSFVILALDARTQACDQHHRPQSGPSGRARG